MDKSNIIINFLESKQFYKKEFIEDVPTYIENKLIINKEKVLNFENCFVNLKESEMYIVVEKDCIFTNKEIVNFEVEILTFINFLNYESPLKYNINLVLLCPFENHQKDEISRLISNERSKNICRKLVFNSSLSNEEIEKELVILPSFSLGFEIDIEDSIINQFQTELENVIDNSKLYSELIKNLDEIDFLSVMNILDKGIVDNE
jgi:hypothetical protein